MTRPGTRSTRRYHAPFIDEGGARGALTLYTDRVVLRSASGKKTKTFDFDTLLAEAALPVPMAAMNSDHEVLRRIVALVARDGLSPEAQRSYDFYRAIHSEKVSSEEYEIPHKWHQTKYIVSITPYGVVQHHAQGPVPRVSARQRLHHFYLYGPRTGGLPLDLRRRWRETIRAALGDPLPATLTTGFALFDYDRIEQRTYTVHVDELTVSYLSLERGYVSLRREEPYYEYTITRSYEDLWYNQNLFGEAFSKYADEIHRALRRAVMDEPPP